MAANGPIDKAHHKIQFVSRLVTATYAESIQLADKTEVEINAHIAANPFLSNESIFDTELKKYQNRWDKLALILQRVLGAKEILEHYLKNEALLKLLPDSSVENMRYLQDWCENKFERESDCKAFEAILKSMLAELYLHEGHIYNYTPQMKVCAEIRSKFDALAAQPLETKYLYMIFSSYQNLWLNKQRVLEQQIPAPNGLDSLVPHTPGMSSASNSYHSMHDVQVNVTTSISVTRDSSFSIPPPPPLPPPTALLPLFNRSSSSSSSSSSHCAVTLEAKATTKASLSTDNAQLLEKARAFKEKRKMKTAQAQALQPTMTAEQAVEEDRLIAKRAADEAANHIVTPATLRAAHMKGIVEQSAKLTVKRKQNANLEALIKSTSKLRIALDKEAEKLASQFISQETGDKEADTSMPSSSETASSSSEMMSNSAVFAKFYAVQRVRASGSQTSDDDNAKYWSDDDSELEDENAFSSPMAVPSSKSDKQAQTDEEDAVDVTTQLIQKLSLKVRTK